MQSDLPSPWGSPRSSAEINGEIMNTRTRLLRDLFGTLVISATCTLALFGVSYILNMREYRTPAEFVVTTITVFIVVLVGQYLPTNKKGGARRE